MYEVWEIWEQD